MHEDTTETNRGDVHPDLCPDCLAERFNTPSGSICLNGHGGIFPAVPPETSRQAMTKFSAKKLPKAVTLPIRKTDDHKVAEDEPKPYGLTLYTIVDQGGIYYRVARDSQNFSTTVEGNVVVLFMSHQVIELRLWGGLHKQIEFPKLEREEAVENPVAPLQSNPEDFEA